MTKNLKSKYNSIVNEFYALYRKRKEKYVNSVDHVDPITKPSCWLLYCNAKMREIETFRDIFKRFNVNVETKEQVDNLEYLFNKFRNLG